MKLTYANIRKLSKEEIFTRLEEEIRFNNYVEERNLWLKKYEHIADNERDPKAFGLYLAYTILSIREKDGRRVPCWYFCDKVQEFMDFEYFDEILDVQWKMLNHPLFVGNNQDIDYSDEQEVLASTLDSAVELIDWSINNEDGIAWLKRELEIGEILIQNGITDHYIGKCIELYY